MITITEYHFEVSIDFIDSDGSITTYSGHEWAENALAAITKRCQRHNIDPSVLRHMHADWHGGCSERTIQRNS